MSVTFDPARFAKMTFKTGGEIVFPWWPDEIAYSTLAPTWTQLPRPGKVPLLVQESLALPTLSLGFMLTALGNDRANPDAGCSASLSLIRTAASAGTSVTVLLGSVPSTTSWAITEFSYTELEWTRSGEVSRAEVQMVLTVESLAAMPRGPVAKR
jgi:hypothetical protein